MKKCSRCKKEKDNKLFGKRAKNRDGLSSICKDCKRVYDNNYHYNRTDSAKKRKGALQYNRLLKCRKYVYNYLSNKSCVDCGEKRVAALDFDHLSDKEFNVSDGVKCGYSLEKIKKEIEKCEVRCANCHRVKTSIDFGWYSFNNIDNTTGCDLLE